MPDIGFALFMITSNHPLDFAVEAKNVISAVTVVDKLPA